LGSEKGLPDFCIFHTLTDCHPPFSMRQCPEDFEASQPAGYRRRSVDHAELTTASSSNPFDARGPFLLSLFMTLVGYSVLVALPAINSAWVDQLGFSEIQVNRVASADLLGLFIGAVLTSLLIRTWNRQTLTYLGIALAIAANGLCTQYVDYQTTLVLRLVAGLGAGLYTAVAVAGLGAHSKPREAFNWMLLAFAISQFLELQLIPHL